MKKLNTFLATMILVTSSAFSASGDTVFFEDFSSYKDGEKPAGWLGGDNLGVKESKHKKILAPFVNGNYDVTTKSISFPENFIATMILRENLNYPGEALKISFGGYSVEVIQVKSPLTQMKKKHLGLMLANQ